MSCLCDTHMHACVWETRLWREHTAVFTRNWPVVAGRCCRIGGRPYLMPGEDWPSNTDRPLAFLWQFRVNELPRAVQQALQSHAGLLQVFIDEASWGQRTGSGIGLRVGRASVCVCACACWVGVCASRCCCLHDGVHSAQHPPSLCVFQAQPATPCRKGAWREARGAAAPRAHAATRVHGLTVHGVPGTR